jgi:MFS family permease
MLVGVLRNRGLRRTLAAYAAFALCEYAMWIGMLVVAYDRGGAREAGLVALAQLLPSALVGFGAGRLADRWSLPRVLLGAYAVQALGSLVVAAALLSGTPVLIAYAGAVVASSAVPAVRPTQSALLPSLARDPAELTGSNIALNVVESLAILAAGLVVGVLVGLQGPGAVFAFTTALLLAATALTVPLLTHRAAGPGPETQAAEPTRTRLPPAARTLAALLGTQFVVVGALDVLFVVLAVDVLDAGQAWTGYLNTAYGVGALAAGGLAAFLVGRRLGPVLLVTACVLGAALAATATTGLVATVALLAVVGGARSLLDVSCRVLLQRTAPPEDLARVFALSEGLSMLGLAAGALLVPVLIDLAGPTGAVVGAALLLPAHVLLTARTVHRLDRDARLPVVQIALLRHIALFRALPAPETESLASAMRPVAFPAGEVLVRQGEAGHTYLAIADGEVRIDQDGRPINLLHRGDGLGEVALLRSGRRTATATAVTPVSAYSLDREDFLRAVVGHAATSTAAEQWVRGIEERDARRRTDGDPV